MYEENEDKPEELSEEREEVEVIEVQGELYLARCYPGRIEIVAHIIQLLSDVGGEFSTLAEVEVSEGVWMVCAANFNQYGDLIDYALTSTLAKRPWLSPYKK